MTLREYFQWHPDQNMSWCKPYISDNERVVAAVNEEGIICLRIDGEDIPETRNEKGQYAISDEAIKRAAMIVNPDYADYEGYSEEEKFYRGDIHETGCAFCPWRDDCEVMDYDDEEE